PAPNDDPRCWPCGRADLSRHGRCTGPLQELQGSRSGVWTDTRQVSVGRERPNRRNITVRRRDDADDALRSGPEHGGALDEMILAQGLGDEDRQTSRDEEGNRGAGASLGRLSAWTCRHTDGKAAQKIVPPRLRIPMMEGPWCRVRREARARER